uniref:Secreted protein n=1 Tax=Angiostrongylus cantonensis TaxID=6313 RepID=A0A0K0CX64_ANGCA
MLMVRFDVFVFIKPMIRLDGPRLLFVSMWRLRLRVESRRWAAEEDLARHEGEAATSRRITSVDHRLGSSALMKTKSSKR